MSTWQIVCVLCLVLPCCWLAGCSLWSASLDGRVSAIPYVAVGSTTRVEVSSGPAGGVLGGAKATKVTEYEVDSELFEVTRVGPRALEVRAKASGKATLRLEIDVAGKTITRELVLQALDPSTLRYELRVLQGDLLDPIPPKPSEVWLAGQRYRLHLSATTPQGDPVSLTSKVLRVSKGATSQHQSGAVYHLRAPAARDEVSWGHPAKERAGSFRFVEANFDGVHVTAKSKEGGALMITESEGRWSIEPTRDTVVLVLWPLVDGNQVIVPGPIEGLGRVQGEVVQGACEVRPVVSRVMSVELSLKGSCEVQLTYPGRPELTARVQVE